MVTLTDQVFPGILRPHGKLPYELTDISRDIIGKSAQRL